MIAPADPLLNATPEASDALYAHLRATSPAHFSPTMGGWVLTRYPDVRDVLRSPLFVTSDPVSRLDRLLDRGGPGLENFRAVLKTISFFMQEPAHDHIRRFLSRIFQGLDLAGLSAPLRRRAEGLLAAGVEAGAIDLADYGRDLTLFALHRLLGLPLDDCDRLARLAREVALYFDAAPRPLREIVAADAKLGALLAGFRALVRARRDAPNGDGLSLLVTLAQNDLGADDATMAGYCAFFFVAGEETTATAISRACLLLVETPDVRRRLAADPALAPRAAKELLRLTSSFQYVTRVAVADARVGGQDIRKGQSVVAVLAAANRDPEAFPAPDVLDLDRDGPDAIPFGYGAYRCLGARMATFELEAAIQALAKAPPMTADDIVFEPRLRIPALARARVRFGAETRGGAA